MKQFFIQILGLTALIAIPSFAFAQTELEEFEEIAETMSAKMNQIFVTQRPALVDVLPDVEWDEEFRTAGRCMLKAYRAEGGDEFVTEMLLKGREFAETELNDFSDFQKAADFMPDGISDERQIDISRECGMTALTIKRMEESGLSDALRDS